MKIKKYFMFLAIILTGICLFDFSSMVNAATIDDNGTYSLVLATNDDGGSVDGDGEYAKLIKFNVAEGETKVKLSVCLSICVVCWVIGSGRVEIC